jgi:hypothetical protein
MKSKRNSRSRKANRQKGGATKQYICTCKSENGGPFNCTCSNPTNVGTSTNKPVNKPVPAPTPIPVANVKEIKANYEKKREKLEKQNIKVPVRVFHGEDIGVFVSETDHNSKSSGSDLLLNSPLLTNANPELVKEIVSSVCKDVCTASNDVVVESQELLNKDQCLKLIELAEQAYSKFNLGESTVDPSTLSNLEKSVYKGSRLDDFKTIVTVKDLVDIIGDRAYDKICDTLGISTAPNAIAIRRTVAENRWINFHTDNAQKTVQVPLSHDDSCVGGKLVFALPDGSIVQPTRVPGSILYHHGDVVHGVTQLTSGKRYGLFVLVSR